MLKMFVRQEADSPKSILKSDTVFKQLRHLPSDARSEHVREPRGDQGQQPSISRGISVPYIQVWKMCKAEPTQGIVAFYEMMRIEMLDCGQLLIKLPTKRSFKTHI